jgi:hypothetical protein
VVRRETARESPSAVLPDSATVLAQLDRILSTSLFQHSKRYPALLRHIVEQTLRGASDELKERTVGIAVFGRPPDYDTSADPVVRNTASEVRKRLEEYYSGPGRGDELRISLPSGGYVPEFRHSAVNAGALSAEPQLSAVTQRARLWGSWAVGVTLLAALGLLAGAELLPRKSAVKLFWAPILQTPDRVLVVTDTLVGLREPQTDSGDGSRPVRETIDPNTYLHVNEESAKLASFLIGRRKNLDYELARNVTLAGLRNRPFILKGAFNNQWTQRAVSPFRFYFQLDRNPLVRRIVDRQNPERRDWSAPMEPRLMEDFALIVRAPEPETGQMMLVIAGLGEKGTAAAQEFVTNPIYIERFASQAPKGWERQNIELVLRTKIVNDDWGEPRVVAMHFW